ncbi:MAG: NifB/NifX family molybdenum-iron cluster-binding protein [Desulfobulbaceae bacterium]|jgi:predicted Fe-Mo cluster-binding NifX family protein|nr:NifB/NifX family molybdenum-iron cluster-binding protein [Desulfobulbaceae bacterium]
MKIAISSTGEGLNDQVDPRFGRAPYLCLYDTGSKAIVEVINNGTGVQAAQGAGITVAGLVASKNVEFVLTGKVGPKAMAVLDKAHIKVISDVTGSVADAVAAFTGDQSNTPPPQKTNERQPAFCRQSGRGLGGGQGQGRRRGGQGRV